MVGIVDLTIVARGVRFNLLVCDQEVDGSIPVVSILRRRKSGGGREKAAEKFESLT